MTHFNRQLDIINPDLLKKRILVIGAGGIGSWTTLALAKMGCRDITVMDFDSVSKENLNSQIYTRDDIGRTKVEALADHINTMVSDPDSWDEGFLINTIENKWEPGMDLKYEIIISALDSMETRKALWEDIKKNEYVLHYIDGRMGGEYMKILYLNLMNADMRDYEKYEKTIVAKENIDPTPCTAKAVVYNTFVIGGIICDIVKKIVKEERTPTDFSFDLQSLERI